MVSIIGVAMDNVARAKIFMHGRSQAVRLPKQFRLPGQEVEVFRQGADVVLRPIRSAKPDWKEIFAELDALGPVDLEIDRHDGVLPDKNVDLGE